jgi:hypothetical protein
MTNRFPGSVEELEACFVGNDATHSSLRIYFEDERGRRSAAEFEGEGEDHAGDCLYIRSRDAVLRGYARNFSRRAHGTANRNTSRVRQHYSGLFASLPALVTGNYRATHAPLCVSPLLVAPRPVSLVSLRPGTLGVLVRRRWHSSAKLLSQNSARRIAAKIAKLPEVVRLAALYVDIACASYCFAYRKIEVSALLSFHRQTLRLARALASTQARHSAIDFWSSLGASTLAVAPVVLQPVNARVRA